jgi:hypothetical protein
MKRGASCLFLQGPPPWSNRKPRCPALGASICGDKKRRPIVGLTRYSLVRMTDLSRLRKRPLETGAETIAHAGEIDIVSCATIACSSEHPAHPAEHMLDGRSGPGATRWMSARPDTVEHIVVEFDQPQTISRLVYEVEERYGSVLRKYAWKSPRVEAGRTAKSWFRNTLSVPGEPLTNARNYASISIRSAISVLRSFPTRVGPAPPRLRRSVSLFRHIHHVSLPL